MEALRVLARPRSWALWQLPTPAVAWILATEVAVAAATTAMIAHEGAPSPTSWVRGSAVAIASVLYAVLTRPTEERRRAERLRLGQIEYVDQTSIFLYSAALLLPMAEVTAIWVILRAQRYVIARRPPARWLTTSAAILASALGAHLVADTSPTPSWLPHTVLTGTLPSLPVLLAAAAMYFAAQAILIGTARGLTDRRWSPPALLGTVSDNMLIVTTLLLAAITALLAAVTLPSLALMTIVAVRSTRLEHRNAQLAAENAIGLVDRLTGLPTRHILEGSADQLLQPLTDASVAAGLAVNAPVAMLIIDVDHFKRVNDTYGHPAGDEVLRAVASTLAQSARRDDVVGRWGGEEFLVVAPATDLPEAVELAERLRRAVERLSIEITAAAGGRTIRLGELTDQRGEIPGCTVSIGVAVAPTDGITTTTLIQAADQRLLTAKRTGRNRVHG